MPLLALKPVLAIADTKSAIVSFLEPLSSASIIAILSLATLTAPALNPFKFTSKVPLLALKPVLAIPLTKSAIDLINNLGYHVLVNNKLARLQPLSSLYTIFFFYLSF